MPASCSIEGKIETEMRELQLSARNLCEIARLLHVPINTSKLSIALSDKKRLDDTAGEKLLGLLEELKAVRRRFPDVPIDWSRWQRVSTLVVLLRVEQASAELDREKSIAVQQ